MRSLKLPFFTLAFGLCFNDVISAEVRIKSADEFINFKNNVNSGTNYQGTTVFLDSDIDFTGKAFEPIGNSSSKYFRGIFDGQGYVISNLDMNSSSQYVGLFGYSEGLIIKNVILDSFCSFTSNFSSSSDAYVGGIIGECEAFDGPCTIENSVNMGSVSFSGNISISYGYLHLGGIAGRLYSSKYESTMKNCANYGDVTHSGACSGYSYLGGIVGKSKGYPNQNHIYNSLNHGTVTHSGTTSRDLYIGGIAGHTYYTTIENCVSGGTISSAPTISPRNNYIGSIVGEVFSKTIINYCYYTSDLSDYDKYGFSTPSSESNALIYYSTTFKLNESVSIGNYAGESLIGVLNAYSDRYILCDYSHWLLNKEKKAVSFTINGRTSSIKMNSQIILLPSLASEGKLWFDGWYKDSVLTTPLTSFEIVSGTKLYGKWEENTNNYIITFDTRGGSSVPSITAPFNSVVTLPSNIIDGKFSIGSWETIYSDKIEYNFIMPARNFTLYAVWKRTRIETPDDFIDFSNGVNNGVDYFGLTVFLDSDIDFSGKSFEPIGNKTQYFNGVFDGQGYVISNLKISSSSQYVGLFGYSGELTIRNVIIDSSCSITNSFIGSGHAYAGGIIGYCQTYNDPCIIENSVNIASVSFNGNISGYIDLYLGGIAGYLYSYMYKVVVKNCANYGDITHSGTSYRPYIGGLAGHSGYDFSNKNVNIYNSLNLGTITHNGTSSFLLIGGMIGETYYTKIENCVNGGKISMLTKASNNNRIGTIVGLANTQTIINYCYFTSDLSGYESYGSGTLVDPQIFSYDNTTFELNETVSTEGYTGNSLIDTLNGYADYKGSNYSHWLLNKEKKAVSFTINGRKSPIKVSYQIILMPTPASGGNMIFDGWYEDKGLTVPLTLHEVNESISLYGALFSSLIVVSFDVNGGNALSDSEPKKEVTYNSTYGDLPKPMRTGYTFLGWFTEAKGGEEIKSGDVVKIKAAQTLYAHWTVNTYTITFNTTADDVPQQPSQQGTYDSEYGTLPEPERTGYTFAGWFTEEDGMGERITEDMNVSIADNHTLYAHWDTNNYIITFNDCGGEGVGNEKKNVTYDDFYGDLPEPTKTGYTFAGWFTEEDGQGDKIESGTQVKVTGDVTLYAKWTINQYAITFIFNNGAENEVRTLDFNETIDYPDNLKKEGFVFEKWDNKPERMPAENITATALWVEVEKPEKPSNPTNPTDSVEIVFGKGFTEEEVKVILSNYIKEGFTITGFERDEKSGETKVIVKFNDSKDAEEFVKNINKNGNSEDFFRNICFVPVKGSFSLVLAPLFILYFLF